MNTVTPSEGSGCEALPVASQKTRPPSPTGTQSMTAKFVENPAQLYDSTLNRAIASVQNMIGVIGYTPGEGEAGVNITVRTFINHESCPQITVRLVIGTRPVATEVTLDGSGSYKLDATVPTLPDETIDNYSNHIPLTVQVLHTLSEQVLDQIEFGAFTYWRLGSSSRLANIARSALERNEPISPASQVPSSFNFVMRRRSVPNIVEPSVQRPPVQTQRRNRGKSMITRKPTADETSTEMTPELELLTPLPPLCENWTQSELQAGRRLISVRKIQEGRKIIVNLDAVSQEEYQADNGSLDCVVSCIYHDETDTCWITSVDIIYLLERLAHNNFQVEEKNRIRRNLEHLRPMTVGKSKGGSENFFQKIMDFPDPKPRNIEKDLKVFEWNHLGNAVERILAKYSIYYNKDSTSPLLSRKIGHVDRQPSSSSHSSHMPLEEASVTVPSETESIKSPFMSPEGTKVEANEPTLFDNQSIFLSSVDAKDYDGMGENAQYSVDASSLYPNHNAASDSSSENLAYPPESPDATTFPGGMGPMVHVAGNYDAHYPQNGSFVYGVSQSYEDLHTSDCYNDM